MDKTTYQEQFYTYIEQHMPIAVEIEALNCFHHDGLLLLHLWMSYNKFADKTKDFQRIPHGNKIFTDYEERIDFLNSFRKEVLSKHKSKVLNFLNSHNIKSCFPEFINYATPEVTYSILKSDESPKTDITQEIIEAINQRNKEVLSVFAENCLSDYSTRLSALSISTDDICNILHKAKQYNGNITLKQEVVSKMIVNADDYFSNIGDIDSFLSGLADSIVEYIKRQEVMEELKNGTETAENLLPT